jgi:hypothetical protein
LLVAASLSACATGVSPLTIFADPGKYEFYNCEQLVGQRKQWSEREHELKQLMDKAEQSTGGALVNLVAYKADYVAATEELQLIELAERAKSCGSSANSRGNSSVR